MQLGCKHLWESSCFDGCLLLARRAGARGSTLRAAGLLGHGAKHSIPSPISNSHLQFQVHVCEHCGLLGYWDKARGHAVCPSTKSATQMARLQLPYACKLLFQVWISPQPVDTVSACCLRLSSCLAPGIAERDAVMPSLGHTCCMRRSSLETAGRTVYK